MNCRRIISAAGVSALAVVGLLGSGAASAAPQEFGNIDSDRTGSLTVHKFLHQPDELTVGDISAAPAAGDFSDPVADVEFTVYPLIPAGETSPLDLSVPANWDGLDTLTPGAACTAPAGFTFGTAVVMPVTNAVGTASEDLAVGLYQVCETDAPDNIVDFADPFILTVPMPFEDGWVYDVHAYPKNGEVGIEKTIVAQAGLGLGAPVQFPVSTAIPQMVGDVWTAYSISDTFDSRLSANTDNDGIATVTVDGAALDPSYYTKVVTGQTVVMEFTTAGIAWLNQTPDHAGKEIVVTFDTVINSVGDGTIVNEAQLWVNNPDRDPSVRPPLPSNEVETHWGALELLKRAEGTAGTTGVLADAVFEIYAADLPYAADCSTATHTGTRLTVDGRNQFTTNADGEITIPGLFVSDSVHPTIDAAQRCYVLREVQAPAGYVLPSGTNAYTPVAVAIGAPQAVDVIELENTQHSVVQLPLTGGQGISLMVGLGVAGLSVAGGMVLLKRRREEANAAA